MAPKINAPQTRQTPQKPHPRIPQIKDLKLHIPPINTIHPSKQIIKTWKNIHKRHQTHKALTHYLKNLPKNNMQPLYPNNSHKYILQKPYTWSTHLPHPPSPSITNTIGVEAKIVAECDWDHHHSRRYTQVNKEGEPTKAPPKKPVDAQWASHSHLH